MLQVAVDGLAKTATVESRALSAKVRLLHSLQRQVEQLTTLVVAMEDKLPVEPDWPVDAWAANAFN